MRSRESLKNEFDRFIIGFGCELCPVGQDVLEILKAARAKTKTSGSVFRLSRFALVGSGISAAADGTNHSYSGPIFDANLAIATDLSQLALGILIRNEQLGLES